MVQDFKSTLRWVIKRPLLSAPVILMLGLAIGFNVAALTICREAFLRPLPLPYADRLVMVSESNQIRGVERGPVNDLNLSDWAAASRLIDAWAAFSAGESVVEINDQKDVIFGVRISLEAAILLHPGLSQGKFLDSSNSKNGIVVSHSLWRRALGAKRDIMGQPIVVDGTMYSVIGIAADSFAFPFPITPRKPEFWIGVGPSGSRGSRWLTAVGRLAPGTSIDAAQAEMSGIASTLEEAYQRTNKGWKVTIEPLHASVVKNVRPALILITATAALILLMTVISVSWVLLARLLARLPEIGIRIALGAATSHLVRLQFAEAATIAGLAGVTGVVSAVAMLRWVRAASAAGDSVFPPKMSTVELDWMTLIIAGALTTMAAFVIAALSSIIISKAHAATLLAQRIGVGSGSLRHTRLIQLLVGSEIALCVLVVAWSGTALSTFLIYMGQNSSHALADVLVAKVTLPRNISEEPSRRVRIFNSIIEDLRRTGGVEGVGAATGIHWLEAIRSEVVPERALGDSDLLPFAHVQVATPGYLEALRVQLTEGRLFNNSDADRQYPAAVITASFASALWPGQRAQGQLLKLRFFGPEPYEVVGVVEDLPDVRVAGKRPQVFLVFGAPYTAAGRMYIALRTDRGQTGIARAKLRAAIKSADPQLFPQQEETLAEVLTRGLAPLTTRTLITGSFAVVAILLTTLGVFGIVSYLVTSRRPELAVRMALGAQPTRIIANVAGYTLPSILIGATAGASLAWASMRFAGFELGKPSGLIIAVALSVVLIPALLATAVPAVRGARLQPSTLLR